MYEAARIDDEIVHTSALGGFLAGAAIGIALVVGVAVATATCGFGVALLWGVLAGFGGAGITAIGETLGRSISTPAGGIISGSPNTFINGLAAARVEADTGVCEKHSKPPQIAQGSAKVFINGLPAARKGDQLTCGATINSGSPNVNVGAETQTYLPIDDEVPAWLSTTVDVLMALGGGIGSLVKMAAKNGLKAVMPCALKFAATFAASEAFTRAVAAPVLTRAFGALFGHPVDAVNGRKLLLEDGEIDFALPGLLPIHWARFYASDIDHEGLLGRGWVLPWEQSLRREKDRLVLRDNQGREVPLELLKPNERVFYPAEQLTVVCTEGGHYLLQTLDCTFLYFGDLPEDGTPAPLKRIEDAYGNYLSLTYREGQLTDIHSKSMMRVHLCYNEAGNRLVRVERIEDCKPVETLVRYLYDAQNQLVGVTNRNGVTSRRFGYDQGLMVAHENALGLVCHYRWGTFPDGSLRVTEHWTSDGERYSFSYDLKRRTTYVIDTLNRKAIIRYDDNRRVTFGQDFGGEQYHITLDESGNITDVTLPDSNTLTFEYDNFSRLVKDTDPLGRSTSYTYHLNTEFLTALTKPDGSELAWKYDNAGSLLAQTDELGAITRYLSADNGLAHTVTDALGNNTYYWWNALGQVTQHQDCSGNRTHYAYDEHLHLAAVTNALGQTTRLHRKPDGEVLRVEHPDGSTEFYTYNALGQLLTHTDADKRTTSVTRNARGLPIERKDAKAQRVCYHYDQALRLAALVNENGAAYRFAYDSADRLVEEARIDGLRRRFHYNVAGALVRMDEHTTDLGQTRSSEFERDAIGRLLSKMTQDARLDYTYDKLDRVLAIERQPSEQGKALGIQPDALRFSYDKAGRLVQEQSALGALGYTYDALGNLTQLSLPDGRTLNHLYYGSGHLHQLNLDGLLISDFERDPLHRETLRTQGSLTSRFGYDSFGRKRWQAAIQLPHEQLSQLNEQKNSLLGHPEHPATLIHRRYEYSKAGELLRQADKHRGITDYKYDAIGQLRSREPHHSQLGNEDFGYDPAGNLTGSQALSPDNRLKAWKDLRLTYDAWGNVSERHSSNGYQRFIYDCENRLVRAETYRGHDSLIQATYEYDCLGRRITKHVLTEGKTETTRFLWQGLRLLQEQKADLHSLYIYEQGALPYFVHLYSEKPLTHPLVKAYLSQLPSDRRKS